MTETELTRLLVFLAIGLVAGWLAALIVRGHGFGLVSDLVLGVLGAFVGAALFALLGIFVYGPIGLFAMAVIGAVILIGLFRMIHTA